MGDVPELNAVTFLFFKAALSEIFLFAVNPFGGMEAQDALIQNRNAFRPLSGNFTRS